MTGISIIYLIRFLSNFCQALLFPFLPVWFLKLDLFQPGGSALIVSCGIFSTRIGSLLFANWVERYSKKSIMIFSLSAVSLSMSAIFLCAISKLSNLYMWVFLSMLIGSSLSTNSLAILSYSAMNVSKSEHHKSFSIINIALNMSSGLGPFLGSIILFYNPVIFPLVPIIFAVLSILLCFTLSNDSNYIPKLHENKNLRLGGNRFLFFIMLNILTFIAYAQFYDVFPIYAIKTLGERNIGLLFILGSLVIILVQMPLTQLMEKYSSDFILFISNLILALGTLLFLPMHHGYFYSILGVIFISIAEVCYGPLYQSLAIKLFTPQNIVFSLALQTFSWGMAEAFATYIGIYTAAHGVGYLSIYIGVIASLIACTVFGMRFLMPRTVMV